MAAGSSKHPTVQIETSSEYELHIATSNNTALSSPVAVGDKARTFLKVAKDISENSTCARRDVGCILVNERRHILATGYNGVPSDFKHCKDHPCPGANLPSGQGLDKCEAIHAEQNALLQCEDVWEIHTAYCTDSPCIHCVKLLLNTSCRHIVFLRKYPHEDAFKLWFRKRLTKDGHPRAWIHYLPKSA